MRLSRLYLVYKPDELERASRECISRDLASYTKGTRFIRDRQASGAARIARITRNRF